MSSSTRSSLSKPILNSPAKLEASESSSNSAQLEQYMKTPYFPEEFEKIQKQVKKEEHKKRLQNLRKELDYISSTNWMFQSNSKV